jgi:hypothetical protein
VKKRTRSPHGNETKSDPTLNEALWQIQRHSIETDVDKITLFQRAMAKRQDLCVVHGDPAPGLDPRGWHRRLSAEVHGPNRTILEAPRFYIPLDLDSAQLPPGSALDKGENIYALADYAREELLPDALRQVDLAIAASSSTGLKPALGSLHAYALLDHATPLPTIYKWLDGAKKAGFPLDPRPALSGQLFLTGRPVFWGLDDPVPEEMRAFVLPGWRRTADVAWNEFSAVLKAYERHERQAHAEGATGGWRSVIAYRLGDGEGKLGFFRTTSIALGYAARSGEPATEVAAEMHKIIVAHPDLTAERANTPRHGSSESSFACGPRTPRAARTHRAHRQGEASPQPRRRLTRELRR